MDRYEFSEENYKNLDRLISWLLKSHKVILILSPYHPDLFDLIKNKEKEIISNEERYRAIALQHGLHIWGAYNPSLIGCGQADFFDGMHPKGDCMKKIFNQNQPKF